MPLILGTNSIKDTGYDVANSLRFNSGSTDSLSRTPSSASNRRTYTISMWFKRSSLTSDNGYSALFTASAGDSGIFLNNDGTLEWYDASGQLDTSRVFRDVSAWYHVVVASDTTQGTASNRTKLYINGVQETDFDTENYPNQNAEGLINNTGKHAIGVRATSTNMAYGGYMAEVVLIDGTALDPTSFGEFDSDSGIWKPKDVSGLTFGTNGFYLDFEDSSALGNDVAGSNNFTVNNLTAVDQSTDTCTNNFATLNPLDVNSDGVHTLSDGNLTAVNTASGFDQTRSTYYLSTGKWFWEFKCTRVNDATQVGVVQNNYAGGSGERRNYQHTGSKYSGSSSSYGATWTVNDIIGIALDLDNGTITFYKNGASQGVAFTDLLTSIDGTGWTPIIISYNGDGSFNFGSPPYAISSGNTDGNGYGNFEYAVPSGYYSLNTKNLAEYG